MARKSKLRVFPDSNVVVSGLYSSQGAPGKIMAHFANGDISVVISQQVLEEVVRTIKRKLPGALPALRRLLVNVPPEIAVDPPLREISLWTGRLSLADAAILAAAVAARPAYFVTGDSHFIDDPGIAKQANLPIVTPAQFVAALERQ